MKLSYYIMKISSKFSKNRHEYISNYYRKQGASVGENCNITSNLMKFEPYLICIGSNTTVSTEVLFVTHDASISKIYGKEIASDLFGKIIIGKNCFVGARSMILYGVTIPDNCIVAAGSVVTKSFFEEGIIIGGNPAKKIGTWEAFQQHTAKNTFNIHGIKGKELKSMLQENLDKLILR